MRMFVVKIDGNYFVRRASSTLLVLTNNKQIAKIFSEAEADDFCKENIGFEKEYSHNEITINKIEVAEHHD